MFYGNILRGRNHEDTKYKAGKCGNGKVVTYGLFIPYRHYEEKEGNFFKERINNVNFEDWKTFGDKFNCKLVFLFDDISKDFYVVKWGEFHKNSLDSFISCNNSKVK